MEATQAQSHIVSFLFKLIHTVKLGYNELGYNELLFIANKYKILVGSSQFNSMSSWL
jgi:hypothetical protein